MSANRRHFTRIAFHAPAELVTGHDHDKAIVVDLSLKGALVRVPGLCKIAAGENCTLHVGLGDIGASIRMQCTVAHIEGSNLGLSCRNIDLDSATHLRRLVELNLGDTTLLERELSALAGDQ